MPKCNKSNFNHVLYNQNRARSKSGDKLKNIIDHVILLKKKEKALGASRWLTMAWLKANAKLKKLGVTEAMIQDSIAKK
ncbi:hypothetical protein KA478_03380 [Patescibacteria group bacterium]|nr:hypothetical protein [Patescibacteria group bacterium]